MLSLALRISIQNICSPTKFKTNALSKAPFKFNKYKAHWATVSVIHQRTVSGFLKYGCEFKHFRVGPNIVANCRLLEYQNGVKPKILTNGFKTTPARYIHPYILVLLKPLARIVPALAGRKIRRWWKSLSDNERLKFRQQRKKFALVFGVLGMIALSGSFYAYQSRTEYLDILGIQRKRFVALSTKQMERLASMEFEELLKVHEKDLLPDSDPTYSRVAKVANRLLKANVDLKGIIGKDWTISVIDCSEKNAFVLPTGNIFVFTGMLEACENDDQLGYILGHEIAHSVLSHGAEQISYYNLVSVLMITPILLLWAILPNDLIAFVADWLFDKISHLLVELPYSRNMETEADIVGIELASKACFDVREAPVFWGKMQMLEEIALQMEGTENGSELPEFLSTHPSHANRQKNLSDLIPKALETRSTCGCNKLSSTDPLAEFMDFKNYYDAHIKSKNYTHDKARNFYELSRQTKIE